MNLYRTFIDFLREPETLPMSFEGIAALLLFVAVLLFILVGCLMLIWTMG